MHMNQNQRAMQKTTTTVRALLVTRALDRPLLLVFEPALELPERAAQLLRMRGAVLADEDRLVWTCDLPGRLLVGEAAHAAVHELLTTLHN